ncbi:MAG: DUF4357 domain-containing protein [Acetobacter sp.]|nr:DUF4357 domain-containing protein [Acetobacter sp.]
MTGTTIQIHLPDDDPKSIKKAKMTTKMIEIIQIPRSKLSGNYNLLAFNGIYILVDSLRREKPEIYIGKGDVQDRARKNDRKKDFWTMMFAIQLKNESGFNDAHNSYLEHYFVKKGKKLNLAIMNENKQTPKCPILTEEMLSELESYIDTIEILLSTLGLKCFQPLEDISSPQKDIFTCSDKYGNFGKGEYTEDGFLLYKGSICKLELHKGTKNLPQRDEMICSGQLKSIDNHYVLQEDKLFSSVSSAASIVLGRMANGWLKWKNQANITLDELVRS